MTGSDHDQRPGGELRLDSRGRFGLDFSGTKMQLLCLDTLKVLEALLLQLLVEVVVGIHQLEWVLPVCLPSATITGANVLDT